MCVAWLMLLSQPVPFDLQIFNTCLKMLRLYHTPSHLAPHHAGSLSGDSADILSRPTPNDANFVPFSWGHSESHLWGHLASHLDDGKEALVAKNGLNADFNYSGDDKWDQLTSLYNTVHYNVGVGGEITKLSWQSHASTCTHVSASQGTVDGAVSSKTKSRRSRKDSGVRKPFQSKR